MYILTCIIWPVDFFSVRLVEFPAVLSHPPPTLLSSAARVNPRLDYLIYATAIGILHQHRACLANNYCVWNKQSKRLNY